MPTTNEHQGDGDAPLPARQVCASQAPGPVGADSALTAIARSSARACLMACSRAPMVNLLEQLASARTSILLADTCGEILDMVGYEGATPLASEHWPPRDRAAPGVVGQHDAGASPARGGERFVFGIAAPINAASGGVLGLLDRSGRPGWGMKHVGAMLQLTAETIERRVVEHDERGFLLLRFHTRVEMLEGPFDAIALFDRESRLIGYNKLAGNLLSLSRNSLDTPCQTLIDTQWPGLVGSAALAKATPIRLRARNGTSVLARARLR